MQRKIIGIICLVAALTIATLLILGGGPLLPHLAGPLAIGIAGIFLLAVHRKG